MESSVDVQYLPQMPVDKSPAIGCIGAGFIVADCHLPAYRNAGFRPVAISARRLEQATEVAERHQLQPYASYQEMLANEELEVVDIGVPPDVQLEVVRDIVAQPRGVRGILAQKPLGTNLAEAVEIVRMCEEAGIVLAVNQNMRYDQSIRGCRDVLQKGWLGQPVFATIEMRAIPHWMPWQERQGWVTLRILSIHHLDSFRFLFGDPQRVYASVRTDPRTSAKFEHTDGICSYILEYEDGLRASAWDDVWAGPGRDGAEEDIYIRWRVEGTEGLAQGTIGWPSYPERAPSTLDFTSTKLAPGWHKPRWPEVWFPDAFAGTMAQLLVALETGQEPEISGRDNLKTMALVEACYASAEAHRAIEPDELLKQY